MASSDVIELGSSDDEAEPVSKKICRRVKKKPTPNAMVHFPDTSPGLTIKPVKPALPNLQKVLAGGSVTITNVKKGMMTPHLNKAVTNGKPVQRSVQKSQLKMPIITNITSAKPLKIKNLSLNPYNLMNKQQNSTIQRPKLNLPPGITVKRTAIKQKNLPNEISCRKIQSLRKKPHAKEITTVELDDEEVTHGTSPQWYLRPEEQISQPVEEKADVIEDKRENDMDKDVTMEIENNKEPDTRRYIEITIEDSPIKPLQIKKGFEVGSELPITIEDSPVKPLKNVIDQSIASDTDTEKNNVKEPQSKKKLDYPNGKENSVNIEVQNVVEISLDVVTNVDESKESSSENKCADIVDKSKTVTGDQEVNTPRRAHPVLITKEVNQEQMSSNINLYKLPADSCSSEFHPIYQKFIDLCFDLENSEDMVKIVEKKIKTYYKQCSKEYVESEDFTDMVSSKILAMKAAPDKMYLYIKDVVDELNLQRKTARAVNVLNKEKKQTEKDEYSIADDGEYDRKCRRQIRKLEKTIKKLHRAIQKLEEQEVDFEDEEDSVYLLTERYKERLIRVHAKFCQLTNTKMPSEPRIQIEARPGYPTGPAKKLEKWVNKKVPIGTPLPFPDFHDVLKCVRDANVEDRLGWNEADIMDEARDLFTRCGKKLQRRRQENEWRIAAARLPYDVPALDSAEDNNDLKKKLEENKALAAKKEIELFNKYADKQHQLKLVGEEIGDKEAEESPVESEDDECQDESNSLQDKQKRKNRLKRLLHEKTRKDSSEKDIFTSKANEHKDDNASVEQQEKLEFETVLNEPENKKEDIQNLIKDAEVKIVSTIENAPIENRPSTSQSEGKIDESNVYEVDSDIDELHLLQKLYSESENHSSTHESGSDTPIAISDTLDSDSDAENVKLEKSDDIISIENSSYSESELTKNECEDLKSLGVVKEKKKIDCLLFQNAEISLTSSTLKDKMDIDEENILLASSEEENNETTTHLNVDRTKFGSEMSNDHSTDCEVIVNNSEENSLENDIKTYEVPLDEANIYDVSEPITSNNLGSNQLNIVQGHSQSSEKMSKQSKTQLKNDIEIDESRCGPASIEKHKDGFKVVESIDVIVNELSCNTEHHVTKEIYCPIDKVELKIMSSKDTNIEQLKDNLNLSYEKPVIEGNNKSYTMFSNEQDSHDLLLSNQNNTTEDIATGVQSKQRLLL